MKGVTGNTLVIFGHGSLVTTCCYVMRLMKQQNLINMDNAAVLTFGSFLLLGLCGLSRYIYPVSMTQRFYRELSSISHAVGLISLSIVALDIHAIVHIPKIGVPVHIILLISFLTTRVLFGPRFEDTMTKCLWCSSVLIIFYTGLKAHHWVELVGTTFLAFSFVTFYFNRTFSDNRVIFGISDLVWYLLMLNISLFLIGHSFFADHPGYLRDRF